MAPKKKPVEANEPSEDDNNEKKPPPKDHSHIDQLTFNHAVTRSDGSRGRSEKFNLEKLVAKLRTIKKNQVIDDKKREKLAGGASLHERDPENDATITELEANVESMKARGTTDPDLKAAKKKLSTAKGANTRKEKSRDTRFNDHMDRVYAQARYEDFLYLQNARFRHARLRMVDPNDRAKAEAERRGRPHAYMLHSNEEAGDHFDWLHSLLEYYDSRGIADEEYREGRTTWQSNIIPEENRVHPPLLGPGELRLWNPRRRRFPVGLRLKEPVDSDLGPVMVGLDLNAIEAERYRVDSTPKHEKDDEDIEENHNVRRARLTEMYRNTRPNTSNILVKEGRDHTITQDRWREIQTAEGLFIAARESSWDWLTSYDSLDRVGRHDFPEVIPESAVREEVEFDGGHDAPAGNPDDALLQAEADPVQHPDATSGLGATAKKGKKRVTEDEDDAPATSKKQKIGTETLQGEDQDSSRKGYPHGEFWDPKRDRPDDGKEKWTITPWTEMTDGRRERHVYQELSPASSVGSPPHIPIYPGGIEDTPVPTDSVDGFWNLVGNDAIDALEPSRRRCEINPERCRAWWSHDAGECWFVNSSKIEVPTPDSNDDIGRIESPGQLTMPEGGVVTYRNRLSDHYGLARREKSQWPKRGIRIPYEPYTHDDRKIDPEKAAEGSGAEKPDSTGAGAILAADAHKRAAFSFRSMDVPIIDKPFEDWGEVGEEPPPTPPSDGNEDEESSDDDGDLFRRAYLYSSRLAGSGTNPGNGGGGGGGGSGGNDVSSPISISSSSSSEESSNGEGSSGGDGAELPDGFDGAELPDGFDGAERPDGFHGDEQ